MSRLLARSVAVGVMLAAWTSLAAPPGSETKLQAPHRPTEVFDEGSGYVAERSIPCEKQSQASAPRTLEQRLQARKQGQVGAPSGVLTAKTPRVGPTALPLTPDGDNRPSSGHRPPQKAGTGEGPAMAPDYVLELHWSSAPNVFGSSTFDFNGGTPCDPGTNWVGNAEHGVRTPITPCGADPMKYEDVSGETVDVRRASVTCFNSWDGDTGHPLAPGQYGERMHCVYYFYDANGGDVKLEYLKNIEIDYVYDGVTYFTFTPGDGSGFDFDGTTTFNGQRRTGFDATDTRITSGNPPVKKIVGSFGLAFVPECCNSCSGQEQSSLDALIADLNSYLGSFKGRMTVDDGANPPIDVDSEVYFPNLSNTYVDDDWAGSSNGDTVFFPGNDTPLVFGTNAFDTIQAGIDAAIGSTVHVAAGTYYESPIISTSMTLEGDGCEDTEIVLSGANYLSALEISGSGTDATIRGFTITGYDAIGMGLASTNILVYAPSGDTLIEDCCLNVGKRGPGTNYDDGFGLLTEYSTSLLIDSLTVTGCSFDPVTDDGRGFFVNAGVDVFTFTGNSINALGSSFTQAHDGLIEDNMISGHGSAGSRVGGVGSWGYPDPSVFGITTFRGNTISDAFVGIRVYSAEHNVVEENAIADCDGGILVADYSQAFDASTNLILNNGVDGSFGLAIANGEPEVVDASGNWVGANDAAAVAASVSAGSVDYTPWLDSGTDTDGAAGFQGDFSALHVDDDSAQTGATERIPEAIGLVTASTVYIHAGTYPGDIVADVPVNLIGDGIGLTIIAPAVDDDHTCSTFAGAAHHGVIVRSSDVSIQAMTIDGSDTTFLPGADLDFRQGVVLDFVAGTFDNVDADNVEVKNIFRRGLYWFGGTGHDLTNVSSTNCNAPGCPSGHGYAAIFLNGDGDESTVDWRLENATLSDSETAIGTNYTISLATGPRVSISDVDISGCALGMNLSGLTGNSLVDDNTITGLGAADDYGIIVQYALAAANLGTVTVSNNELTACDQGIWLYHNEESDTPIAVSGNDVLAPSVLAGSIGMLMTDDGDLFGDEDGDSYATLASNAVTGFETGIYLYRNGSSPAGGRNVLATIGGATPADSNEITDCDTGILVFEVDGAANGGYKGRASILNNRASVVTNEVGLSVDGGAVLAEGNQLSGNTTAGIVVANGGLLDAGDEDEGNVTGLGTGSGGGGSSAGGNYLVGYTATRPAIDNQNLDGDGDPNAWADMNLWATTPIETVVRHTADDSALTEVFFSSPLAAPSLTLEPNLADVCFAPGDTVTVDIEMTDSLVEIVGGQYFLSYDNTRLDFVSADPGDEPFDNQVFESVDEGTGTIDYATGVFPFDSPGTSSDTRMAVLTFTALSSEACSESDLVEFRVHSPPTRLTDEFGGAVLTANVDLGPITIDDTAPVITIDPIADQTMDGSCDATVSFTASVSDPCSGVDADDVDVAVTLPTGNALLGTPSIVKTQVDDNTVTISGSVLVSDLTSCPATVQVSIDAVDCSGNASATESDTADVDDVTAPVLVCGGDIPATPADAGGCDAEISWTAPTTSDNCDPTLPVLYDIDLGNNGSVEVTDHGTTTYTFPTGTHKVTAKSTDACGNTGTCSFLVTVTGVNELVLDIQLSPTMDGAVTRCITFELYDCPNATPTIVEEEISFDAFGLATGVTIEVPCGVYDCVTARDRLHTLRRTADDFLDAGTNYTASFTGDVDSGGDWLVGGNLNDDAYIDILDFGVFVWQYGTDYGTGDTTCSTPYPHADITGDGLVDTGDFTFIQINFLDAHEANCCGFGPGDGDGGRDRAVRSITVEKLRRRGMAQLAAGDLNGDGLLDEADMIAFQNGARPKRPETGGDGQAQDPGSVEGQDRP